MDAAISALIERGGPYLVIAVLLILGPLIVARLWDKLDKAQEARITEGKTFVEAMNSLRPLIERIEPLLNRIGERQGTDAEGVRLLVREVQDLKAICRERSSS